MKILLDHNVPAGLRHDFPDEMTVETASFRGWAGLENGALLRQAADEYEVLVTLDTGIPEQPAVEGIAIGVVVVDVHPISPDELRQYMTSLIFGARAAFNTQSVVVVTEDSVSFE
jgi:predicted nuclease of predicted toxin-antitoxin system